VSAYRSLDRTPAALGPVVRSHARKPRVGPAPLVLSGLAASASWLGALSHPVLLGAAFCTTALAMIALVLYLADVRRLRAVAGVVVHENGLHILGARSIVLPWSDLSAVELRRVTRARRRPTMFSPIPGLVVFGELTEEHWILRVRAGTEIVAEISDDFEESTELGNAIRAAIAAREIPRMLEAESGRFGPFTISEPHLDVAGVALPWSELASVEVEGPYVVVTARSGKRRGAVPVQEVPNAHVLVAVATEMIEKRALRLE
jgi:hypothetical protein